MTYPNDFEQKLGFDQIRQRLHSYCLSPLGIRLVDEMAFSPEYNEVKKRLHQNLEFKQLLQKSETFPSANYFDPSELWPTVAIEGTFIEEEAFHRLILSLHTLFDSLTFLAKNKEVYPE